MNEITLAGCTPTPLASYLKALGVLRLLSAKYPRTRGFWRGDQFVLSTELDRAGIEQFFLRNYIPTPIISPWSGRAGFLEGDEDEGGAKRKGAKLLDAVTAAEGHRFRSYQQVVEAIRQVDVVEDLNHARAEGKRLKALKKSRKLDADGEIRLAAVTKQEKELKDSLLLALRNELDDAVVPWIDACFALASGERTPGPLLGSGGNEGSMDFSINHVGYLLTLIDENTDTPTALATQLLPTALFGTTTPMDASSNIGFLDTLATGGANMSSGFDGGSTGNTWDSVLAMEGALLFASSTTKRLESTASGRPSFPFAVSASFAGAGSLAEKESARSELWLPTWSNAASMAEVETLLMEGRVTHGAVTAASGMDMLQAIAGLGSARGITAFYRFGFYERRGQGYYVATALGRFEVPETALDNWLLNDLNQGRWLDRFRRFAQGEHVANRFRMLRKQLEDTAFAFVGREPSKAEMQELIALLGTIQVALANSSKAREEVGPIPHLSERWVTAADDNTPAFRIAKALAGLQSIGKENLPLRAQLFPVERHRDAWLTPKSGEAFRICSGQQGRLIDTLHVLLERRLWLADKLGLDDKPLRSKAGVELSDIMAFLSDNRLDARIAALLPGLSLCVIPKDTDHSGGDAAIPAAFALLKLSLTPNSALRSLKLLTEGERLPLPAGMTAQLAAGNRGNRAVTTAWRRLRASGIAPLFAPDALPTLRGIDPLRACAALLIPLRFGATTALARSVTRQPETSLA